MPAPDQELTTLVHALRQFPLPDNYLVADVETTGFSYQQDLIVEVGWAVIQDRKLVHSAGLFLDWRKHPLINIGDLERRLRDTAAKISEKIGTPWHVNWERLCVEGEEPLHVLHTFSTLLYDYISKGGTVVGHGFWQFDRTRIDIHTQRFLDGYLLPWRDHTIYDTGLIEKGIQLCMEPTGAETRDGWQRRVNGRRVAKGVNWNLEGHCMTKYGLDKHGLAPGELHEAGYDCRLIHHFAEVLRNLGEEHGKKLAGI